MTYYSTLREAYNVDSFNQIKKSKKKNESSELSHMEFSESFMNDYSQQDDCYYKNNYNMDTGVCNKPSVSNFTNGPPETKQASNLNNQTTQQQTMQKSQQLVQQNNLQYQQMMKNEKAPANVESSRLSLHSTDVSGYQSHQMNKQGQSCSPLQAPNYEYPISDQCKKDYERTMKIYTNDTGHNAPTYDEFNKNNALNNIQPFYDEDLEQYFDFNNLKDAVNYKPAQLPNENKIAYTNNNTNEYTNTKTKNNDLLLTNSYNLSEDDKRIALQALKTLREIEEKINKNSPSNIENMNNQYADLPTQAIMKKDDPKKDDESKKSISSEKKSSETIFYNNIINLGLFVFIGIIIILLCDQIAEVAIQIGMKRTINMLQPYLQKPIPSETSVVTSVSNMSNI
jgi:hypothetical protein